MPDFGQLKCLEAIRHDEQFQCVACFRMNQPGSVMVWLPDGCRISDPVARIEQAAKANKYNGSFTGICISCALRIGEEGQPTPPIHTRARPVAARQRITWLQRFINFLRGTK